MAAAATVLEHGAMIEETLHGRNNYFCLWPSAGRGPERQRRFGAGQVIGLCAGYLVGA